MVYLVAVMVCGRHGLWPSWYRPMMIPMRMMLCCYQMEGVMVPMTRGSMDDIAQEADPGASQSDSTVDSLSTQGARQIYERESHIVVDYSHLDDDYKDVRIPVYLHCVSKKTVPVLFF